jgi:hypothetical protein
MVNIGHKNILMLCHVSTNGGKKVFFIAQDIYVSGQNGQSGHLPCGVTAVILVETAFI